MRKLAPIGLVLCLTLTFCAMAGGGFWMIYISADTTQIKGGKADLSEETSEVNVSAKSDSFNVEVKTAIPGVIVFVFGAGGLLLMLIKVPVKQILLVTEAADSRPGTFSMMTTVGRRRTLSSQTERIPLLVWLLIRNRDVAKRV